jgi:hypothetical protein
MIIDSLTSPTPPVQHFVLSLDNRDDVLLLLLWCALGRDIAHHKLDAVSDLLQLADARHTDASCTRLAELLSALMDAL